MLRTKVGQVKQAGRRRWGCGWSTSRGGCRRLVAIISAKDLEAAGVEQNHESGQGKPADSTEQPT